MPLPIVPMLPLWAVTGTSPAFYDTESKTALQQTSVLYGKMRELIDAYNETSKELQNAIDYMETNLGSTVEKLYADAIKNGSIKANIETTYDSKREMLVIGSIFFTERET